MEIGLKVFYGSCDVGDLARNLVVQSDVDFHLRYQFNCKDDSVHRPGRIWILDVHVE